MPLSLNDVSAWVAVDDKELEQYGVEEDVANNQVTCWIAAEVDKSFSVVFRDDAVHREHSLCSKLQFDGSTFSGDILYPSAVAPGMAPNPIASRTVVHRTRMVSPTAIRPFMFSKVELTGTLFITHVSAVRTYASTEEDEYLGQGSAHLGEIQISIYRAKYLGKGLPKDIIGASNHTKVHEREKKAVTHCVSYGQEVRTKKSRYSRKFKYLDGRNAPLTTFIFKYRDFGLLQANGIIPQPPPVRKRPVEALELTIGSNIKPEIIDEEIEIIEDTHQSTKRATVSTRKSSSGRQYDTRPAKRIKQETEFIFTGEVIDLT